MSVYRTIGPLVHLPVIFLQNERDSFLLFFRDIKLNAGNVNSDNADIAQLQKRLDKATNELKKLSENSLKSSKASVNATGFDNALAALGDGGKLL